MLMRLQGQRPEGPWKVEVAPGRAGDIHRCTRARVFSSDY